MRLVDATFLSRGWTERFNARGEIMRVGRTVTFVLLVSGTVAAGAWMLHAAAGQIEQDARALVIADRLPTNDQLKVGVSLVEVVASNDSRLVSVARQQLPEWIEYLKPLGSGKIVNIVGASLLARGVFHGERRAVVGGLTLLEGDLILGVVVDASKDAFGRVRPNHPGPGRWFAGGDSFPSSHAAHAFLVASVVDATLGRSRVAVDRLFARHGGGAPAPARRGALPDRRHRRRHAGLVDRPPPLCSARPRRPF